MAHFYAGVHGNRGPATRLGSKDSGIESFVNGWDAGVKVEASHRDGKDVFVIYATSGSNGYNRTRIGVIEDGVVKIDNGPTFPVSGDFTKREAA